MVAEYVTDALAEAYIPTMQAGGFQRPFSWRPTAPREDVQP